MGFVPFTYWGYGCNDLLPTGSLVFYYNANNDISFDKTFTGSANNTNRALINLANQGTNLAIVYGTGSFNETYYGIDTLSSYIENNIPLTLYDSAQQGTILLKGYISPLLNAQNKYLLRNPSNSNEGIRAFGTVNTTTKGQFTFSRGVVDANGLPTASMYTTEGYGTIALTKEVGQTYGVLSTSANNFSTKFSGSAAINDFDYIFENLGYFQAAAYWSRKLSDTELISASAAFNCNGLPQGYNATTASTYSNIIKFSGGSGGTTAYYLAPNETTLTRRPIGINEVYYACVSNSGSRLTTGGSGVVNDLGPCPTASVYPTVTTLLVAGGGGGGDSQSNCGGGGAGGYLQTTISLSTSTTYPIVIGNGGARLTNGENTTAFGLTAIGGGRGGYGSGSTASGSNGGSGGGQGLSAFPWPNRAGLGTAGQGNNGGRTLGGGGGGGGAFAVGGEGRFGNGGGFGGDGNFHFFTATTYAGGGGGSYSGFGQNDTNLSGFGGAGGGGNSAWLNADPTGLNPRSGSATNGAPNTGGGGGAGYTYSTESSLAGSGGSGIVVITYSGSVPLATGGTITSGSGWINHTFTSSGNFIT
jgi:hypothetical protein